MLGAIISNFQDKKPTIAEELEALMDSSLGYKLYADVNSDRKGGVTSMLMMSKNSSLPAVASLEAIQNSKLMELLEDSTFYRYEPQVWYWEILR